jgi:hypothetical protein
MSVRPLLCPRGSKRGWFSAISGCDDNLSRREGVKVIFGSVLLFWYFSGANAQIQVLVKSRASQGLSSDVLHFVVEVSSSKFVRSGIKFKIKVCF